MADVPIIRRPLPKLTRNDARSALVQFVLDMDATVGFLTREEAVIGMLQGAGILAHKTGWTEAKFKAAARRALKGAVIADARAKRGPRLISPGSDTVN